MRFNHVKFALRSLARTPGYTLAFVLTLGQLLPVAAVSDSLRAFSANTGAFAILNRALLIHFIAGLFGI